MRVAYGRWCVNWLAEMGEAMKDDCKCCCPRCGRQRVPLGSDCLECGWKRAAVAEPPIPSSSPITVIRERIEELRRQHANYAAYQADRVREGDNHAVWDSAIDMNLVDYEIKGLEFAMKAMGVTE